MIAVLRIAALALCSIGLLFAQAIENWPHWRGPNLNGTSTTAHDLPTTWDDSPNVVWKTKLPSWGASTLTHLERLRLRDLASSSPLTVAKTYVINEDAVVSVLEAGPEFNVIAVNQLEGFTLSSPAVSGNQLFFRTSQFLYCISSSSD